MPNVWWLVGGAAAAYLLLGKSGMSLSGGSTLLPDGRLRLANGTIVTPSDYQRSRLMAGAGLASHANPTAVATSIVGVLGLGAAASKTLTGKNIAQWFQVALAKDRAVPNLPPTNTVTAITQLAKGAVPPPDPTVTLEPSGYVVEPADLADPTFDPALNPSALFDEPVVSGVSIAPDPAQTAQGIVQVWTGAAEPPIVGPEVSTGGGATALPPPTITAPAVPPLDIPPPPISPETPLPVGVQDVLAGASVSLMTPAEAAVLASGLADGSITLGSAAADAALAAQAMIQAGPGLIVGLNAIASSLGTDVATVAASIAGGASSFSMTGAALLGSAIMSLPFIAADIITILVNTLTGEGHGISRQIMIAKQQAIMQQGQAAVIGAVQAAKAFADALRMIAQAPGGGQVQYGIGSEYTGESNLQGGAISTPGWPTVIALLSNPSLIQDQPQVIENFLTNLWGQLGESGAAQFDPDFTLHLRLALVEKLPYTPYWNGFRQKLLNQITVDPRDEHGWPPIAVGSKDAAWNAVPDLPQDAQIRAGRAVVPTVGTWTTYRTDLVPPQSVPTTPERAALELAGVYAAQSLFPVFPMNPTLLAYNGIGLSQPVKQIVGSTDPSNGTDPTIGWDINLGAYYKLFGYAADTSFDNPGALSTPHGDQLAAAMIQWWNAYFAQIAAAQIPATSLL